MIKFFMVLLAGLLTTQGLQAETRVYNFTNVKTNTDAETGLVTTTGLVADNGNWDFNKDVTVSTTGGVNFTLPTGGKCVMQSSNNGFYDIKKVTINAKVAESGHSITFGAGISSKILSSTTFTDIELCPTDYSANGGTLVISVIGEGTVYMKSITVEWTTPGSISYATTTVDKTFGDAAFTNPLTKTGSGTVTYSSSKPAVATVDDAGEVTIVGAGDTEITATVADNDDYTYATKTASYTLNVAEATMTVTAEGWSGTYDGNSHSITVTAPTGATVKYGTVDGTYDLTANPTYTEAGTYTVYYQVTKDNYTTVTGSKTVAITEATMTVTAEGWSGTYDGNSHSITVTAPTGATVKYGTVDGTYDLTANPTYTEVGTYTVYYQVTKDNYTTVTGSKTVAITEATMTVTAEGWSGTYDGNSHSITVTAPTGATVKYGTVDGTYDLTANPTYTEVGTYTVYYQVTKDNYTTVTGSKTVAITEATMTVTAEGWSGTYDGNAHGITVTAPTGATVKYGTNEGTYDLTTNPTYTEVGTYTVYYQVTKDNYTPVTGSKTVTITEATLAVTAYGWSGTYDGNPHGITVTPPTGATVKYGTVEGTYDLTTNPTYTEVGTYTVYYQVTKDNYTPVTGSKTVTITEATLAVTAEGWSGTFDGNPHGITVTAQTGATVKYGIAEGTYNLDASPTYTEVGVYTVYYQVTQANYATVTGSKTVNITAMAPVVNDNTEAEMTLDMDYSTNTEIQTTTLTNVVIENILYTLNDQQTTGAEDDGYDSNSGMLVLNTVVTDEDINKATTMQPGTMAYAETFKGLTMILPQGYGEIEVSSFQEEGHALCVKIGDSEPVILSHEETLTDIIPYAVSEPTYVYVYHTLLTSSDNIRHRGPKTHVSTGLNGMKVHASVIDNAPEQPADYKLFSADELDQIESTADGGIVIDDSEITDLEDDLFVSRIEAGEEITYIDLRNTSIYDMTVDRTKGAFRGVPATTFIYMPAGNSSKSPNVVIGSVCADLQLTDDSEATYQQLFDFMATNATYNHSVSAGESTTLYLPFVVEAAGDGMFFEFGSTKSGGVVCMQAVEQPLEPNTPYVFRAGKEDVTSFTAKSVAVKKADTQRAASQGPVLMGTYEKITIDGNNAGKYYDLKNNRFTRLQPGSYILPFSVYLWIDSTRDTLSLQWSDEASGVSRITTDQMPETGWYTLSGQKLEGKPAVKGLYLNNGKKMVVK
jgi:hypothetical protein